MSCIHLNQIREVEPSADGCEECLQMERQLGAFALVRNLRPRRLLRFVKEQTRDQTFRGDESLRNQIVRAGRRMGLLLLAADFEE